MDIRQITPAYHVSPQIAPEDFAALAEAGYARVICNRPDAENPPELHIAAMAEAAKAAGIEFEALPVTGDTLTPEVAMQHRGLCDEAGGKVLAYCRSGTRCTYLWAFGQAGDLPADEIIAKAAAAGYDIGQLEPVLNALASR
ncbi:TIGR01244 family sulfur transferase [Mesobacterium pallidum]|uniref:TIGR01244 family sulfur transferase n=1 Tax=Mesobacterium pallidum TaxID=2872037 RepID=UPI001EE188BB|nr:TIGR01244 family sulfur transferase [Mesobacterium pallidum]